MLGWLVTSPCAGSGGCSRCWKVVPDEKPSRRTLILEGLDAPSSTLQRGFNPGDPRNNHPTLVHPFACRSHLRMVVPSTVWPERDVCRSFFPFFPTNTMSFSLFLFLCSLSLVLLFVHLSLIIRVELVNSEIKRRYRAHESYCRLRLDLARRTWHSPFLISHVRILSSALFDFGFRHECNRLLIVYLEN